MYVNIPYMDPMGCKYRGHEMTPTQTMHYEGEMPQIASCFLFPQNGHLTNPRIPVITGPIFPVPAAKKKNRRITLEVTKTLK